MKRNKSEWNKKRKKSQINKARQLRKKNATVSNKRYKNAKKKNRETIDGRYPRVEFIAPVIFSLTENTEETISFLNDIINEIKNKEYRKTMFIDSSKVEYVTTEALIYLIALMDNTKINKAMQYTYVGNLPQNESARNVYKESGFMSYVQSKMKMLPKPSNKMQIVQGLKNDPQVAKSFSMFVMEKLGKQRQQIAPLQSIFIELMSNVYHHAYNEDGIMERHWYMYAEVMDKCVRFVFVDTGMGIARTVRKKVTEKLAAAIGKNPKDGALLESAFKGEFRTQTGDEYRGNGLLRVKEKMNDPLFIKFDVISGRGRCTLKDRSTEEGVLVKSDYKSTIYGTVYTFDVA